LKLLELDVMLAMLLRSDDQHMTTYGNNDFIGIEAST